MVYKKNSKKGTKPPVPQHIKDRFEEIGFPVRSALRALYQMRQRCYNPLSPQYPNWGARGIKVSMTRDEYLSFFVENYEDFRLRHPVASPVIGRIDHDKDYQIGNILLCTTSENALEVYTRSGNPSPYKVQFEDPMKYLTVITYSSVPELAKHYGVSVETIRAIKKGISWPSFYKALGARITKSEYGALCCI